MVPDPLILQVQDVTSLMQYSALVIEFVSQVIGCVMVCWIVHWISMMNLGAICVVSHSNPYRICQETA